MSFFYIHYIQTQHTLHHENIHSGRKIFSSPNDKSRLFSAKWCACELSADSLNFSSFALITRFPLSLYNAPHPYSWHLCRFSVQQSCDLFFAANNTIMQWVIWQIDQQWKRVVVSSQCRWSGNRQWNWVLGETTRQEEDSSSGMYVCIVSLAIYTFLRNNISVNSVAVCSLSYIVIKYAF